MKTSEMFPSRFLGKEDVTRPIVATIQRIGKEEIKGDGGNQQKNVLYFAGNMKPMILNKGNAMLLAALFGDDSNAWVGRNVEVYCDPSVMFGGKMVGGVRLRAATTSPTTAPTANGTATGLWTWPEAVDAAKAAGMNEEALKAILKQNGKTGYLASRDTAFVKQLVADLQHVNEPTEMGSEIPF